MVTIDSNPGAFKARMSIEVERVVPEDMEGMTTTNHNCGSNRVPSIRDLRSLRPEKAYCQYGDFEVAEDHIIDRVHMITPNGLVATWLSLDVFARTFAEYIVTPEESIDPVEMSDRVMEIIFDALEEEFGEGFL